MTAASLFPFGFAGLLLLSACTAGGAPGGAAGTPASSASTSSSPAALPPATGRIDLSQMRGRIAFSAGQPHREEVYVINADGAGLTRVTADPAADFDPTWSPAGTRIAYRHQPGDDLSTDIYVINTDGSGARNLTRSDGIPDWGPAWSPKRRVIAWNSDPGAVGMLHGYLMAADGSAARRLAATDPGPAAASSRPSHRQIPQVRM